MNDPGREPPVAVPSRHRTSFGVRWFIECFREHGRESISSAMKTTLISCSDDDDGPTDDFSVSVCGK